jgi:2-oxo-4-hydroxy-4-carboxy-5-ureidoimidazoline decarboxylase
LKRFGSRLRNMNDTLDRWNVLPFEQAEVEILHCCGSKAWAHGIAGRRPLQDEAALLAGSDEIWNSLSESDWIEAFRSHPRIGESQAPDSAEVRSAKWSAQEQRRVAAADDAVKSALEDANRVYERRFNRTFIVCATGKTAPDILQIMQRRMQNDDRTELREAAEQQREITHLRLRRWLWG